MVANVLERFEFRSVRANEAEEIAEIEKICFPPHEAVLKKICLKMGGTCTGTFSYCSRQRDWNVRRLFKLDWQQMKKHFVMSFSQILPYIIRKERIFSFWGWNCPARIPAGRVIAREIMNQYVKREQAKGRKMLKLTCLEQKVEMYKKMGYKDEGISASVWGDEEWHEMRYIL